MVLAKVALNTGIAEQLRQIAARQDQIAVSYTHLDVYKRQC